MSCPLYADRKHRLLVDVDACECGAELGGGRRRPTDDGVPGVDRRVEPDDLAGRWTS